MTILNLLFTVVFTLSSDVAAAGKAPQQCSGRSLVETKKILLPQLGDWKVTAKNRAGEISCAAIGKFKDDQVANVLYVPNSKYRGGKWFFSLESRKHRLPPKFQGPAELLIDDKSLMVGEAVDVADWVGQKRTADYVRAEFSNVDPFVAKLSAAKKIEIRVKTQDWKNIEVPRLTDVIRGLNDCADQSSAPNGQKFWQGAEQGCG